MRYYVLSPLSPLPCRCFPQLFLEQRVLSLHHGVQLLAFVQLFEKRLVFATGHLKTFFGSSQLLLKRSQLSL